MHMVTTCPSCLTSFIVKPEQLESHQGQVRCSQCQHVFNALEHTHQTVADQATFLGSSSKKIPIKNKLLVSVLIALLVLAAITQATFYARSTIAQHWPISKPYLSKVCHALGCEIALPMHAELINIDDTDLVKDETHTNIIQFSCTLTNNAPYTQAFPFIELTLTDNNNQPLMRRKIAPKYYLKLTEDKINAGLTAGDEARVHLNLKTDQAVAGFSAFVVSQ